MTSTSVAEPTPRTITTRVASPAFVGRGAELAQLEGALARAAAGEPAVALSAASRASARAAWSPS